jgi:protein-disulfide isomerase
VLQTYARNVRLVYKDYPLPNHPHAQKAAEGARCAGEQDKYWEMHDKMFVDLSQLAVPALKKHAAAIGLDQAKFDQCLDSGRFAQAVAADAAQGEKLGVNSTPSFFINGRPLVGAQPFDAFKTVIDEELARNRR